MPDQEKSDYFKALIISLLTLIAYGPTFAWMFERWMEVQTYYSHGFLVPLISSFIVWQRRKNISKLKRNPSNAGWLFFIPGICINILSAIWQVFFTSGFSLILVIIGLILLFLGKDHLKQLLFPTLFLVFMVPLPLYSLSNLSFQLKTHVSQIATVIVNLLGIEATREGSVIKTMHSYLVVEDPCSGVRSLIAMIALGALTANFSRLSKIKRLILALSSVPIAVFANVIRIVVLALVIEMYGAKAATGKFHDIMGFLLFVFAFLGLLLMQEILRSLKSE